MNDRAPLPEGISFFPPRDNAPEFVLGTISINPAKFVDYLTNQSPDEKGYIKFQVLKAKSTGKPYVALDTWKPKPDLEEAFPGSTRLNNRDGSVPF